jgi:CHASE2 domain-containing sensor protein
VRLSAAWAAAVRRCGSIRLSVLPLLAVLAVLIWVNPAWIARTQSAWFDAYQAFSPRHVETMPAIIVEIDQKCSRRSASGPGPAPCWPS